MGSLIKLIAVAVSASLVTVTADAADIYAASASDTDIQAAIDDAGTVSGDTIHVPGGDVTWTSSIDLGNKNLSIIGAGIGVTTVSKTGNMINLSNTNSRISGFTLKCTPVSSSTYFIYADCETWFEVDNCRFEKLGTGNIYKPLVRAASPSGGSDPKGVIHSNQFVDSRVLVNGDLAVGFGRDIWAIADREVGTANTVFVEYNTFEITAVTGGNCMDNSYGGHYVFRYNTVTNSSVEAHGITSTGERGNKFVEISYNTFIRDTDTSYLRIMFIRGGAAVIYENEATSINGGNWSGSPYISIDSEVRGTSTGQGNDLADGNLPHAESTGVYFHNGSDNATTLSASGASWTTNQWVGMVVFNRTDGSSGAITANDATTVTASLSGGAQNDWDIDDEFYISDATGTHTGSNGATTLTDSAAADWTTDEWVGPVLDGNATGYVWNLTDGSVALITANNGTTVTGSLSGGSGNVWDTGDVYKITFGYPWRDQIGTGTDAFEYTGTGDWPEQSFSRRSKMYEWNNTVDSSDLDFRAENGSSLTAIENRDYFNDTSAITVYGYTPIAYPHPLRSDAGAPASVRRSPSRASRTGALPFLP